MSDEKESYLRNLLNPGEKIIFKAQIHATAYLFPFAILIIGGILAIKPDIIIELSSEKYDELANAALKGVRELYFGFIVMFMACIVMFQIYQARKNNLNALTTQRILTAKGAILYQVTEIYLHRVQDVKAKQSMFERLLGRGRIKIKFLDQKEWVTLDYIGDPKRYKNEILKACSRFSRLAKEAQKKNK